MSPRIAITKGNDDRDVHGEQAETSEAGLGLVEAGQLAEDDQQQCTWRAGRTRSPPPAGPRTAAGWASGLPGRTRRPPRPRTRRDRWPRAMLAGSPWPAVT